MMWVSIVLILVVAALFAVILYRLIGLIPKVNKIAASILSIMITGLFTYEWISNIASNLLRTMP
jgi:cell division protein FtsW (lipid II flippase)